VYPALDQQWEEAGRARQKTTQIIGFQPCSQMMKARNRPAQVSNGNGNGNSYNWVIIIVVVMLISRLSATVIEGHKPGD